MLSRFFRILIAVALIIASLPEAQALPSYEGRVFGIMPLSNEISFYRNLDDSGIDRGMTLQVIAINSFKIFTEFNFEFTADFNWDMSHLEHDHYMELSLVKAIGGGVSINYQRVISKFEDKPINQFGLRLSF
ncbi:MAG: hypothetical protein AB1690_04305 [Candidatus Zixiibacteriota bacterium]